MNRTVLVLGASEEFIQLVRLAKNRGIRTVVCDGRPGAAAKAEASIAVDIAVTNVDAIASICKEQRVDGVITGFSDLLLECATLIAHKAGLSFYLQPQQLPYYRDKNYMKQMFRELGIRSARHVVVGEGFDADELASLRFPVVAKPLDKYGSRGVCVLHSADQVRTNFDKICETSDDKRILVEEYNQGYEFNLMSWVHKGCVYILGIADREKTAREHDQIPYSCRNVYPSRLQAQVEDEALDILQRIVAHTGQAEGELSMQFFWQPGASIEVCEVAARFLGYEHELISFAGGMPLEELLLDSIYDAGALDNLLAMFDSTLPRVSAVLYFHALPGVVKSQERVREIANLSGIQDLWLFYNEGDTVRPFAQPYFARCTMTCDTREQIDLLTAQAYELAHVQDVQGHEMLYQNQFTHYPA